jgi:hypothetical protein
MRLVLIGRTSGARDRSLDIAIDAADYSVTLKARACFVEIMP